MSRHGHRHHEKRSGRGTKWINVAALFIVALAALAFPVYWKMADQWREARELRQMADGDARIDLAEALERGDRRLIAMQHGERVLVPGVEGVPQFEKSLGRPLRLRIVTIEESFDQLDDQRQQERQRIHRYAVEYNLQLLDRMREPRPTGKEPL